MKFDFRNKCVVLSGVTGGIGRALCRRLIEEYGCRVIGVARSPAKAARLKEELGAAAGSLEIRLMDAGVRKNWEDLAADLQRRGMRVDVLLNNAGVMQPFVPFDKLSPEREEAVLNTNFHGVLYAVRALLPLLEGGLILNVISASAFCPIAGTALYTASKGALSGFCRCLREELKGRVRVVNVYPGFVRTGIFEASGADSAQKFLCLAMRPERAARKILRAGRKNRSRAVIGFDARLLSFCGRFLPRLSPPLIRAVLKKGGVFAPGEEAIPVSQKGKNAEGPDREPGECRIGGGKPVISKREETGSLFSAEAERVRRGETLALLPLLQALSDPKLREAALRTWTELLPDLRFRQLLALPDLCRTAFGRALPKDFWKGSEKQRAALASLAAFHPDGYVRERAISEGPALRVLLIRLNDWVPKVREAAQKRAAARLRSASAEELKAAFPAVRMLERGGRADHGEILALFSEVLRTPEGKRAARLGSDDPDPGIRAFAVSAMDGAEDIPLLWERLEQERQAFLRRRILEKLIRAGEEAAVRAGLTEKSAGCRLSALRLAESEQCACAEEAALQALTDPSPSMRSQARAMLPGRDFAALYRARLDEGPGALAGLGETGTKADAELLLPFVSGRPAQIRAALYALCLLDAGRFRALLHEKLSDPSPSVVKAAADLIERHRLWDFGPIRAALARSEGSRKKRLFRLMKGASKWEELIFLLESLDDPDLFTAADAGIRRWLDRVNRSAVPITPAQAERLRALLKTAPLDGPTGRALAFLLPG